MQGISVTRNLSRAAPIYLDESCMGVHITLQAGVQILAAPPL